MALDNKLNITDSTELARMEEKISKKKAVELFENGYLVEDSNIDLNFYSKEEIQEKVNEILNEKLKEQEVSEIEI